MDAKEKIIASITKEAQLEAEKILADAKTKAQEISCEAFSNSKAECMGIIAEAEKKASSLEKSGESGAALLKRDKLLSLKGELIKELLGRVEEKINSLPDSEYFDFILDIVKKNATGEKGEILLNSKDKTRKTADFEKKVSALSLTLSKEAAPISGGFILKYGDIEVNGSIAALINAKQEILVDIANKTLF